MRNRGRILALALLLVPAGILAQRVGAAAGATGGPIDRLLQRRTELALTGDQVQKLEAIRQQSAARERDLVAKITAVRGVPPGTPLRTQLSTPAERRAMDQRLHSMAEVQELRQLHTRQIQQARAVLTADQNARAWPLRGPRAGRPYRGMGPGMTRRSAWGGGTGPCCGQ